MSEFDLPLAAVSALSIAAASWRLAPPPLDDVSAPAVVGRWLHPSSPALDAEELRVMALRVVEDITSSEWLRRSPAWGATMAQLSKAWRGRDAVDEISSQMQGLLTG